MKRNLTSMKGNMLSLLTAVLAVSCSQSAEPQCITAEPEHVSFTVSAPASQMTKVSDISGETAVNDLRVFIFREDGTLDSFSQSKSGELTMDCTVGQREIYAFVNTPYIAGVLQKSDLQTYRSQLNDNSPAGLVMFGSVSQKIDKATQTVTVPVKRIVARVAVKKITNALSAPQYEEYPVSVKEMWLSNVTESVPYTNQTLAQRWLNTGGTVIQDIKDVTYDNINSEGIVLNGSLDTPYYYYCYPNPNTESNVTTLVVKVEVNGKIYYYPVPLGAISPNCTYDVEELRITRLGSDDPTQPVEVGAFTAKVKIADWETGKSLTVTI